MSLVSLSSYLVNKVKGIQGVQAGRVYDYEDSKFDGYPAISITVKDWSQTWVTNAQNNTAYTFTIRIYQEITKNNIGPAQAESNLRTLADNIIASFNSDNRLGENAIYTRPIGGRSGYVQDQPIRTYEIDVEVHDVVGATG